MASDDVVMELVWTSLRNDLTWVIQLHRQDIQRLLAGHSSVPFDKVAYSNVESKDSVKVGTNYVLARHIRRRPDPCDDCPLHIRTCVDTLEPCRNSLNASLTRYLRPHASDWSVFYDDTVICFAPLTALICFKVHWCDVINHFACTQLGIPRDLSSMPAESSSRCFTTSTF